MDKTTQMANRFGLNTKIYEYKGYSSEATPVMNIEFANVSEISISGDSVWATGGQSRGNIVGFNNPMTGTFKLSSQIMTAELLALMAGKTLEEGSTTVVFENTAAATMPKYFVITSETVWHDKEGVTYAENLTFHKAIAKRALNITYDGSGDPVSCDIEFELAQDDEGKILTIDKKSTVTE